MKKIVERKVFLIGNPNSGKTSLFNALTGERKRVGNWPGVTVQRIDGIIKTPKAMLTVIDLPGTYSLTPTTPEENIVLRCLNEASGNIILNVVDISNFERNLFLTTQLVELGIAPVVSLNCFDSFTAAGGSINLSKFTNLTGLNAFPTVARTGEGTTALIDSLAEIENFAVESCKFSTLRLSEEWQNAADNVLRHSKKSWEDATPIEKFHALSALTTDGPKEIQKIRQELALKLSSIKNKEIKPIDLACELALDRYQRIEKVIAACATVPAKAIPIWQDKLDRVLTHRLFGLPIFALLMAWIFWTTFSLGEYPMNWLESIFEAISSFIEANMSEGLLRSLLVEGIIAAVGGVLIFVPNILILFFWIALLEDSGYMSRAAFLMDRLMNSIGLHGRAFIPMIMGIGCNVPAVMATRIIENRFQRLLTMLLIPLITCSARLPVLVILCGTFFGSAASLWMFILFFVNLLVLIFLGQFTSLLFKTESNSPFLLEMPPYRLPTPSSVFHILYEKIWHFIEKAGTVILAGTILIWVLSAFPREVPLSRDYDAQIAQLKSGQINSEVTENIAALSRQKNIEQMEGRYMARISKFIHPIMEPLGFSWRETVSLIPGFLAKESVVSTLSVLYLSTGENLGEAMKSAGMTKLTAFVFMLFTLMYIPCIATLGVIWRESGSSKFTILALILYFSLAYFVSFIVLKIGQILLSSGATLMEGTLIVIVVLFSGWYLVRTLIKTLTGNTCKSCSACNSCPMKNNNSCSYGD